MTISPEAQKLLEAANATKAPSPGHSSFWGALVGVLVAAGIAGGVFWIQEQKAERARENAALRRLLSAGASSSVSVALDEQQQLGRDGERDLRKLRQLEREGQVMMEAINTAADNAAARTAKEQ